MLVALLTHLDSLLFGTSGGAKAFIAKRLHSKEPWNKVSLALIAKDIYC